MNELKSFAEEIDALIDSQKRANELFARIKGMAKKSSEPRIKVSPYAKFDKYHHKKKKK